MFFLTSAVSSRKITVKLLAPRISASIFHHGPTSSHSVSHIFPNFDLFLLRSEMLGGSMLELQGELKEADPSEASILIGATRNGLINSDSIK
jgi:hypothetical protein